MSYTNTNENNDNNILAVGKTYLAVGIIYLLYQLSLLLYLWQLVQYNMYQYMCANYVVVTDILVLIPDDVMDSVF